MDKNLGFIGFGKMANAICRGVVNSGFISPDKIFAYDINKDFLLQNTQELGINFAQEPKDVMKNCSNILLATKPFVVHDVINSIREYSENKLIISILAGIKIETYEYELEKSRIERVMPNTPAMVNEGMSVVAGGKYSTKEDLEFTKELFLKLGVAIILDEDKINAVTAVSGSGPAFYYYMIDKIARAGEKIGLP